MPLKDLLRISHLSPADFEELLALAARFKTEPERCPDLLARQVIALYFTKPSTRTRFSFEAAARRLGGAVVFVSPAELQASRGETIEDTARTISCFARALVVRTFADGDVARFAAAATIPVINALTDGHHPCQALADFLTLRERFGDLRSVRLAYVGDGNNVANSLVEAAALAGASISIATPTGFEPDAAPLAWARSTASATGAHIELSNDPLVAVAGAHAVYTDSWLSMDTPAAERADRLSRFTPYRVTQELMRAAAPGAVFMHCLPAHRGEEVEASVIDGPASVVWQQVENRGHTEVAVLCALLEGRLMGRSD